MRCRTLRQASLPVLTAVALLLPPAGGLYAQGQPPQPKPPAAGRVAMRPNTPAAPKPSAPAPTRPSPMTPSTAGPRPASVPIRGSGGLSSAAARPTSIQGAAWRSDNGPVSKALLRLRNVATGKIQATTIASDTGHFAFNAIPDGTYVIEMVTEGGKVMMVGHTFTVAPGETVATFVRMGPKVPWFNGFFGNAAQTVSSSAASTGVTAVAPEQVQPVSSVR